MAAKKVRDDFEGVVHLPDQGLVLKAGDEIPEGVEVGDHLVDSPKESKPASKSASSK
jgi:hypothetical protein